LANNNLNNTYQYNMISKKFSKTMNYVLNYIHKIQSESFYVPVSVFSSEQKLTGGISFTMQFPMATVKKNALYKLRTFLLMNNEEKNFVLTNLLKNYKYTHRQKKRNTIII
jgi:hypothetical protein